MPKKIAVLDDREHAAEASAAWEKLEGRGDVTFFPSRFNDREELLHALRDFHVVVLNRERTLFSASIIDALPRLELIVTSGMRNASIDLTAAAARKVAVCGTRTLGHPTVELTWALILGLLRHIATAARTMRAGEWRAELGWDARGKVLGIMGYGRIGAEVGRIGAAFGMEVIGWSRSLTAEKAAAAGAASVERDEIFRRADIVSLHLPLNPDTRHLVGARELGLMKPTALLVNTARGGIVDQAALVETLRACRIRGAALDVYENEPLEPDHPLRALENVLLSPHLGYVTEDNYRVTYGEALEDILAWLDGRILRPVTG